MVTRGTQGHPDFSWKSCVFMKGLGRSSTRAFSSINYWINLRLMVSWNLIVVDIQTVKALFCYIFVPFFSPPRIRQKKQNIWGWHCSCHSATDILHSFPLNEECSKSQMSSGPWREHREREMYHDRSKVTRCSKGLSIHIWGKWENRSLNEWVTCWK